MACLFPSNNSCVVKQPAANCSGSCVLQQLLVQKLPSHYMLKCEVAARLGRAHKVHSLPDARCLSHRHVRLHARMPCKWTTEHAK